MFRSLLAAAEAKWTAAGQWNQTDRAGANENPETNAVFALRSALSVLPKSGLVRSSLDNLSSGKLADFLG